MRPTPSTIALAGGALLGALTGICALVCTAHAEKPVRSEVASIKVVAKSTATPVASAAPTSASVVASSKAPVITHVGLSLSASAPVAGPRGVSALPAGAGSNKTALTSIGSAPRSFVPVAGSAASQGSAGVQVAQATGAQDIRPLSDARLEDVVQRGISPFKKGIDMTIKVAPAAPSNGGPAKFGPTHAMARAK